MYQTDFDDFKRTIGDLCVAVNRPFNDDLVRVLWEDLKRFPLPAIRERASFLRAGGKRQFTSHDLRPEEAENVPKHSGPSRHPNEDLVDYVLANYPLTPAQMRLPWTHIGVSSDAPGVDGKMRRDHAVQFTGVIVPACPETGKPSYRVMRQDMVLGSAA